MTLDPKTHRLYVAAAEFAAPVTGPDGKPQRPQVVPGTFKVVVYEMAGRPAAEAARRSRRKEPSRG